MSVEDIASGARWPSEVAEALEAAIVGIVGLTPENQKAEWLLFESGALSKTLNSSTLLIPYLVEMNKSELSGPLAQFQAEEADEAGTFSLLTTLNKALGTEGIPQSTLEESFEVWWPRLEAELAKLRTQDEPAIEVRSDRDVINEILENTREQLRRDEARIQTGLGRELDVGSRIGYEIFASQDGRYRWSIVRGRMIALSEDSYDTVNDAVEAAEAVREALKSTEVVEADEPET